jgi:hypothetical protein
MRWGRFEANGIAVVEKAIECCGKVEHGRRRKTENRFSHPTLLSGNPAETRDLYLPTASTAAVIGLLNKKCRLAPPKPKTG